MNIKVNRREIDKKKAVLGIVKNTWHGISPINAVEQIDNIYTRAGEIESVEMEDVKSELRYKITDRMDIGFIKIESPNPANYLTPQELTEFINILTEIKEQIGG